MTGKELKIHYYSFISQSLRFIWISMCHTSSHPQILWKSLTKIPLYHAIAKICGNLFLSASSAEPWVKPKSDFLTIVNSPHDTILKTISAHTDFLPNPCFMRSSYLFRIPAPIHSTIFSIKNPLPQTLRFFYEPSYPFIPVTPDSSSQLILAPDHPDSKTFSQHLMRLNGTSFSPPSHPIKTCIGYLPIS